MYIIASHVPRVARARLVGPWASAGQRTVSGHGRRGPRGALAIIPFGGGRYVKARRVRPGAVRGFVAKIRKKWDAPAGRVQVISSAAMAGMREGR